MCAYTPQKAWFCGFVTDSSICLPLFQYIYTKNVHTKYTSKLCYFCSKKRIQRCTTKCRLWMCLCVQVHARMFMSTHTLLSMYLCRSITILLFFSITILTILLTNYISLQASVQVTAEQISVINVFIFYCTMLLGLIQ